MFSMDGPLDVFVSYATRDRELFAELDLHLGILERAGILRTKHSEGAEAGTEWEVITARAIERARVIILLVSTDYLACTRVYEKENKEALRRHEVREARILPLILRPCNWEHEWFSKLVPLNKGVPLTSIPDRDEALTAIGHEIKDVIEEMRARSYPQEYRLPQPAYQTAASRRLSEKMADAHRRKQALASAGQSTREVDEEILLLRRELREGGQLRNGDSFANGRYLLLNVAGRGAFATVWEAHDTQTNGRVAVKVLHPNVAGDRLRLERFMRGAQAMSRLEHAAIPKIISTGGEDGGYYYFIMEYISGGDLYKAILNGRLHPDRVIPIILRVGEALKVAHGRGVIHRDVKPGNILINEAGDPFLTDFDLVKAPDTTGGTRTGAIGTWIYAPPELLSKPDEADQRSDIYSLAMTTMFCLYGRDLPPTIMQSRANFLRTKLKCDLKLQEVLKKATNLRPTARFRNATEFCEALKDANRASIEVALSDVRKGETQAEVKPKDELMAQLEAVAGDAEAEDRILRIAQERARQRLLNERVGREPG